MRISELAATTDVPVATLKYYLREGVLPPGQARTRTSADYGQEHVERVRLVRALTGVGGLSLATTRRVLEAIAQPGTSRTDVMGAAQRALLGEEYVPDPGEGGALRPTNRARAWLAEQGWQVHPADPAIDELDTAWAACEAADLGVDEERMAAYAQAVLRVAAVDLASVPADPQGAVRQVVIGTVLLDRVLLLLRRLAQQHLAVSEGG